jgi:type 1 glutamine amidotransferase
MKKALIFYGGWQGHDPAAVSARFEGLLIKNGFAVDRVEGVECLSDGDALLSYDLIVPCFTMGRLSAVQEDNICRAVESGVGLAGCHGGMCDAFRESPLWQFITGGQWVSHPGNDGVEYDVNIIKGSSPIVEGIEDFKVVSEQYYLHVDPAIEVLATTHFPIADGPHRLNKPIEMPVAWTKRWGEGRVFYCSLGHNDKLFENCPSAELLMERGMLWAAK